MEPAKAFVRCVARPREGLCDDPQDRKLLSGRSQVRPGGSAQRHG